LLDNIAANGLQALVTPVHAAISSSAGSATIRLHTDHSGAASLSSLAPANGESVETIKTIESSFVDILLPADGDILVKIDVEGHEAVVIDQLMKSRHLRKRCPDHTLAV
jgi:FkbM family methyltransferase